MTYRANTRKYILTALIVSLGFSIYTATRPVHDYPTGKPGVEKIIVVSDGEFGAAIAKELQSRGLLRKLLPLLHLQINHKAELREFLRAATGLKAIFPRQKR